MITNLFKVMYKHIIFTWSCRRYHSQISKLSSNETKKIIKKIARTYVDWRLDLRASDHRFYSRYFNTVSRASESSYIETFICLLHSWEKTRHIQCLCLEEILPKPRQNGCHSVSFVMYISGAAFLVWIIQRRECL